MGQVQKDNIVSFIDDVASEAKELMHKSFEKARLWGQQRRLISMHKSIGLVIFVNWVPKPNTSSQTRC